MAWDNTNWEGRDILSKRAKEHTDSMARMFPLKIANAVGETKMYDGNTFEHHAKRSNIIVDDIDSVGAIMKYAVSNPAVLNFSSYKHPGGMFLNGSKAQEECLCHKSFLYNILKKFQLNFYDWNNHHKNKALYLNRALFTRSVRFFDDDHWKECSVITCAAPNKRTAQKYQSVTDQENTEALKSRIKFVLDVAEDNDIDVLILGAYGCGVFGQDATEVASIFKHYLTTEYTHFEKVVFAIPKGADGNYEKFERVFRENMR